MSLLHLLCTFSSPWQTLTKKYFQQSWDPGNSGHTFSQPGKLRNREVALICSRWQSWEGNQDPSIQKALLSLSANPFPAKSFDISSLTQLCNEEGTTRTPAPGTNPGQGSKNSIAVLSAQPPRPLAVQPTMLPYVLPPSKVGSQLCLCMNPLQYNSNVAHSKIPICCVGGKEYWQNQKCSLQLSYFICISSHHP